jgi:MOSC domain-containing protein YiiM
VIDLHTTLISLLFSGNSSSNSLCWRVSCGIAAPKLLGYAGTMPRLKSINVGKATAHNVGGKPETTGIYKHSVAGPVFIGQLGLTDDSICDTKHHGGPDQAVYVYSSQDYDWWMSELHTDLAPGSFGDNLTIDGWDASTVCVGDRLQIGAVVLEVTAPRIPCGTLAARMDDLGFVKRFRAAERPGVYCRVIAEGYVEAGSTVVYTPYSGERIAVLELFRGFYTPSNDPATIKRYLAAPIDLRSRKWFEEKQQKLQA